MGEDLDDVSIDASYWVSGDPTVKNVKEDRSGPRILAGAISEMMVKKEVLIRPKEKPTMIFPMRNMTLLSFKDSTLSEKKTTKIPIERLAIEGDSELL